MQLIAYVGRLFELQVLRMLLHLPFQLVDLLLQRLRREQLQIGQCLSSSMIYLDRF